MSYYTFYDNAHRPYYVQEPPLDPPDVNEPEEELEPSCICSRCGRGIYRLEHYFGDGGGETWCTDCFKAILKENFTIAEIAEMMGYEVMLCT